LLHSELFLPSDRLAAPACALGFLKVVFML